MRNMSKDKAVAGKKRIIIVEDDADINDFIAYNLRKENFVVEQYGDRLTALEKMKTEAFDIVVLDIMLPGLDGFEVCKKIKDSSRSAEAFIVMVSARSCEQDKLYAYLLGADYYLTKPFNLSSLLVMAREVSDNLNRQFLIKNK